MRITSYNFFLAVLYVNSAYSKQYVMLVNILKFTFCHFSK